MKYFLKFINLIVSINLISTQLLLGSLTFKANYRDSVWEKRWQEMCPILLKNNNIIWSDLETVKKGVDSEIEDINWRFSNDSAIYTKSGYYYAKDIENRIRIFLNRDKRELEIDFLYYPDIEKKQVIDKLTSLSTNEPVFITDEKLLEDEKFLKNELYKRVSDKVVIGKDINISISKTRFKWIETLPDPLNSDLYTARFNYFNDQSLVPLKIFLLKLKKDDKFPEETIAINNDNNGVRVKDWFATVFGPVLTAMLIFHLSIFKTTSLGISKFVTGAISFLSSFRSNILRLFQTESTSSIIDDSIDFTNPADELTAILRPTKWSLNTTTSTTIARRNSVELLIRQEHEAWNLEWARTSIFKNNKNFTESDNKSSNLVFNDFLKGLEPYDINHNMNYLEWSNLDPYKIGKILFNNSDFKISFPLKNPKFVKPSLEMISDFKKYISKKLDNVIFNSKKINNLSTTTLLELVESYLLIEPNFFTYKNEKYQFSIDSFWIEKFEINDKLIIYLNHLLFNETLKIELKLF